MLFKECSIRYNYKPRKLVSHLWKESKTCDNHKRYVFVQAVASSMKCLCFGTDLIL